MKTIVNVKIYRNVSFMVATEIYAFRHFQTLLRTLIFRANFASFIVLWFHISKFDLQYNRTLNILRNVDAKFIRTTLQYECNSFFFIFVRKQRIITVIFCFSKTLNQHLRACLPIKSCTRIQWSAKRLNSFDKTILSKFRFRCIDRWV